MECPEADVRGGSELPRKEQSEALSWENRACALQRKSY